MLENKEEAEVAKTHWKRFSRQRANNTLPHALLFTGPAGTGKLKFAQSLAKFFLCTDIRPHTTQACGNCRACQLLTVNAHPDYSLITLEEKSKVITIEQIRDLNYRLMHTAQLNHYQVAIISPAHAMNVAAANALLKILEEPPAKVVIILITDKIHVLPRTIYSRCQTVAFKQAVTAHASHLNQKLYAILASELTAMQNKQENFNPVNVAKICLDFKLEEVLDCLFTIMTDFIKTSFIFLSGNSDLRQQYFHFYDRLLEIKKLKDNNVNFNIQSTLESLFIISP